MQLDARDATAILTVGTMVPEDFLNVRWPQTPMYKSTTLLREIKGSTVK